MEKNSGNTLSPLHLSREESTSLKGHSPAQLTPLVLIRTSYLETQYILMSINNSCKALVWRRQTLVLR